MQLYLSKLLNKESLSTAEAYACFEKMFETQVSDEDISSFLILLSKKDATKEELLGFAQYLSENCRACILDSDSLFDVCGTGGDGKKTINISTLTAFILAAMDEKVAKHGNYSASSLVGSSNLLEALGVPLADSQDKAQEIFSKAGIVFLHAPLWHPKLKRVGAIRRALGIRTVFNLLGPLLNPTKPQYQLIGTPSLAYAKLLSEVQKVRVADSGREFSVVSDENAYDEVSLTAIATVYSSSDEQKISAQDFGIVPIDPLSIAMEGSVDESVAISKRLLTGLGEAAHEQVVAANTAVAMQLRYPDESLKDLFSKALETIQSGKAMKVLNSIRSLA